MRSRVSTEAELVYLVALHLSGEISIGRLAERMSEELAMDVSIEGAQVFVTETESMARDWAFVARRRWWTKKDVG